MADLERGTCTPLSPILFTLVQFSAITIFNPGSATDKSGKMFATTFLCFIHVRFSVNLVYFSQKYFVYVINVIIIIFYVFFPYFEIPMNNFQPFYKVSVGFMTYLSILYLKTDYPLCV